MDEYATKKDLYQLEERLEARLDERMDIRFKEFRKELIEDFGAIIKDLMIHIDKRFDAIEARLDNHALRLDRLEGEVRFRG